MFRSKMVCAMTLAMFGIAIALVASCSDSPEAKQTQDVEVMDSSLDGHSRDSQQTDDGSDLSGGPYDSSDMAGESDSLPWDSGSVGDGRDNATGPGDDTESSPDTDTGTDTAEDLGPPTLGVVSVAELQTKLATKDFLLINVHVPYAGEIPKTDANLTYEDVDTIAAYIGEDLDREVVVYCLSNFMSKLAGNDLVARGYRGISYLDGGMGAWKAAGLELVFNQ